MKVSKGIEHRETMISRRKKWIEIKFNFEETYISDKESLNYFILP